MEHAPVSAILQNLNRRSVLDNSFSKMILLKSRKKCRQAKSLIFSGRWSKTQNGDQNQINPSLRLQNCSLLNLKRGGGWSTQFMPIPHSNLKIGIGINWVKLAPTGFFLTEFNTINRCLHWLHQWCFTATPLI